jgi:hypothetical protein
MTFMCVILVKTLKSLVDKNAHNPFFHLKRNMFGGHMPVIAICPVNLFGIIIEEGKFDDLLNIEINS